MTKTKDDIIAMIKSRVARLKKFDHRADAGQTTEEITELLDEYLDALPGPKDIE